MFRTQGGACAICDATDKRLDFDHNHKTGAPRGLVCNTCNRGIGFLGDDPERVAKALEYLRKYE